MRSTSVWFDLVWSGQYGLLWFRNSSQGSMSLSNITAITVSVVVVEIVGTGVSLTIACESTISQYYLKGWRCENYYVDRIIYFIYLLIQNLSKSNIFSKYVILKAKKYYEVCKEAGVKLKKNVKKLAWANPYYNMRNNTSAPFISAEF